MNIKEFRIGSYLFENGELSQVYQLDKGGTTFWSINDRKIHKETFREMNSHEIVFIPIPIVDSILIRLGFVKDRTGFHKDDLNGLSISITKDGGYLPCWLDQALFPFPNHGRTIKYVHELQNLYFALTEKELEMSDPEAEMYKYFENLLEENSIELLKELEKETLGKNLKSVMEVCILQIEEMINQGHDSIRENEKRIDARVKLLKHFLSGLDEKI